jgi:hypothetical protein
MNDQDQPEAPSEGRGEDEGFVKILETGSLADIALIKSALEGYVEFFIKGENMVYNFPNFTASLMVAAEDADHAVEILRQFDLKFTGMRFGGS